MSKLYGRIKMVVNTHDEIIHMDSETAETYGGNYIESPEVDDELGLEVVHKPTILEKYGVHCDPLKNSFHASLYKQFEDKGYLSPKQLKALGG